MAGFGRPARVVAGEQPRQRCSLPVKFVIVLEIRASNFHRLAIRLGRAHSISQRVRMSQFLVLEPASPDLLGIDSKSAFPTQKTEIPA
jgi:hypothetical protein